MTKFLHYQNVQVPVQWNCEIHSFFFLALLYISYSLVGVVVYWLCYMKTILMFNFNKYPKVFTILIPYALI